MMDVMGMLWCRWWHNSIMWSGQRCYECRICHRRFEVPWAANDKRPMEPGVYVQTS